MNTSSFYGFVAASLALFFLGVSLVGLSVQSPFAWGANITNETMVTRVSIVNTEPNITSVTITPATINLQGGNTTLVTCSIYYYDYNGWADVGTNGSVNATFYDYVSSTLNSSADKNMNYKNHSCQGVNRCQADSGESDPNYGVCNCTFEVEYYANASNWACSATIVDGGGNATQNLYDNISSSRNATAKVTQLVAIEVTDEIDYGNMSVTETSGEKVLNVTNIGNMGINISVRGFGGTKHNITGKENNAMHCAYNNITIDYQRYSRYQGVNWADMVQLAGTNTMVDDLTISQRTNDTTVTYGDDRNSTYWKLQIPPTVGGVCNGTIVFTATVK
ncbi:MAG: hypothetical protein ABH879_07175 [archaeon]